MKITELILKITALILAAAAIICLIMANMDRISDWLAALWAKVQAKKDLQFVLKGRGGGLPLRLFSLRAGARPVKRSGWGAWEAEGWGPFSSPRQR